MRRAPTARHRPSFSTAVALILLLAGVPAHASDSDAVLEAIALINQYRSDNDRARVIRDARLSRADHRHARAMADRDFFSHVGADGSGMGKRATEAGYVWRLIAENIAAGMAEPIDAVETWIDSPGHRKNLLLRGAAHIGIAHVRIDPDPGSVTYKDYWVMLLAAPQ